MRMNSLIPLGVEYADPVNALARGAQARALADEAQAANALRATYAQHGAGAMQGDRNALAAIAAQDPAAALGLYSGVQDNRRADANLALNQQDTRSAIAARSAATADASRRTRLLEDQAAAAMAQASREERAQAIATLGQFLPEFEAAPDAESWDRLAQATGQEDLVGQFADRETALAIGRGALRGAYEAQSPEGKVQADVNAGLLDPAAAKPDPLKARPGDVFIDPKTMQPVGAVPEAPGFRAATQEESAQFGGVPGQVGPDGRYYPINPPSGMSLTTNPDGSISFATGSGVKPGGFTEGQSKDNVYSTRARGALPTVDQYGEALTSRIDRGAEMVPFGLARGVQGAEFQVAQAAGDEFLTAILRKDTGAAITKQEQDIYGSLYLPQPGDGPDVLAYKKQARARAVAAIEAGMSPAQMLAQEHALRQSGGSEPRAIGQQQPAAPAADDDAALFQKYGILD